MNIPNAVEGAYRWQVDRREFLRHSAVAGMALSPLIGALAGACGRDDGEAADSTAPPDFAARYHEAVRRAEAAGPVAREIRLVAEPGEVGVAPGRSWPTWLYNGEFPGPEIRVREGERLRVVLENRLPDPTTVHWHGVPVPNAMDGVPGITQPAVPPGETFVYDYVAEPAGTYMYHSHVGLQLDRGLVGPLIIEEREPHVAYDREYTLMLDDWLPAEPTPASARSGDGMGGMMGRMDGMMRLFDPARPEYGALLVNGRPPADPPVFEVRRGQRVRLRLVNPASATALRVAIAGHRMIVTHADSRPVKPVTVDSLVIGMGERYDVLVEADNPGAWSIVARSILGAPEPARAIFNYAGAARGAPLDGEVPAGLSGGRTLRLENLRSIELDPDERRVAPDRQFDLDLSWGMMMNPGEWTIDGRQFRDAPPLEIHEGEHVRVQLTNRSPIHHPMHLHGHFFRVGNLLKETVLVPAHMGRVAFEFTADNPGDWLFHCHNLYHLEAGMARVFGYV